MALPSRSVLAVAFALALAAPAHAANDDSPGALKKQGTTPEQAAPQAQAPVATEPTPAATPKTDAQSTPVNKGTTKNLIQTQTTAAPSGGPTKAAAHTHRRTRTQQSTARARSSAPKRRAVARHRPHAAPVRAHGKAGAPGQAIAPAAPASAPGQAIAATRTNRAVGATVKTKPAASKAKKKDAPLASITQAADNVVEVIPGTIVLALAGLVGLVMMLILRSLTVERQRGKALATSYGVTVEALATAIEAKDLTTGGHIERVRSLGLLLAGEIVPRETRDPQMAYGFLLHDIGKLAVPDAILRAPGRLTEEQWTLMRRHPEEGVKMLSNVPFLDRALDVVHHHHERWDGGGYPDGLKGEEIPLWARIFAVVDALDAITAERPYRPARPYQAALEEIRRHSGTQFDPAVVEALDGLDPAAVEPLLEPAQQLEPLAALPDVGHLVPA